MESKNKNIFSFLTLTFVLFTIDILMLMIFAHFVGEGAQSISTMYQFGSKGLAISTMLQFLLSAATVTALNAFFYSERIFKNLMTIWRATFMLICILITHIVYIIGFGWFSFDNYYAWLAFFIFLIIGFVLGLLFIIVKTRLENKQYDKLLSKYKEQHEEDHENE